MSMHTQAVRKIGMTAAEQFWYVLGCVWFGAAYLQKVPVKKALSDYGLTEMTAAESFWYVLGCLAFGSAYFMKVPVAKALSELPQYQLARSAPHGHLQAHDPSMHLPQQTGQASLEQVQEMPQEQRKPHSAGA